MWDPEYYRRQADLTVEAARWITLIPHKEKLLAVAENLRDHADKMEAARRSEKATTAR
jgi:2-keto-4-pentenoate hydratase/2-oxohepta-3-ene-1,7-dioic acid hydratase in catechol pathway